MNKDAELASWAESFLSDPIMQAARTEALQQEASRTARRPQGSAYSQKWAHGHNAGKRRMALRLGRTRRICPQCWETERITPTSDRYPYCAMHVPKDQTRQLRIGVLLALGVQSHEMHEWVRIDDEQREMAAKARKPRVSQTANMAQVMDLLTNVLDEN